MPYEIVKVVGLDDTLIGYTVHRANTLKLEDTNIYSLDERSQLAGRVEELNDQEELRGFWPDARDPELLTLLNDEDFEPVEDTTSGSGFMQRYNKAAEIIARKRQKEANVSR